MTEREMTSIFKILKAAYPNALKQVDDPKLMITLWCRMFQDNTASEVANATAAYIATDTSGFMPSIGAIKKLIIEGRASGMLTEEEAWSLIRKAASRGYYEAGEQFDALPDELKRFVGSPSQLRAWAEMAESEFETVVASNFRKSYRIAVDRAKTEAMIPHEVRKALGFVEKGGLIENQVQKRIDAGRPFGILEGETGGSE